MTNDVGLILNSLEEKLKHKFLADIEALRKKETNSKNVMKGNIGQYKLPSIEELKSF